MRNEGLAMRGIKYNMTFGIAFVCVMLFTACDTFVEPPETHTPMSGYGRISVSLTAGEAAEQQARTVFPSAVFDRYEYTFTKEGEAAEVKVPDIFGYFTLEVGNYEKVAIKAYVGTGGAETLAASGESAQFSVVSGDDNEPVAVCLTAEAAEGLGEFTYTINYPPGATAVITLEKWPDLGNIPVTPQTNGNSVTETLDLEAGFYLLTALISKSDLYAGINETVHIYPAFTTVCERTFTDDDLLSALIPTAANYTIGTNTFTYDGSPKTASITRKEIASPGAITVLYDGAATEPVDVGTYAVTFNVEVARGWEAATGLVAGMLTINRAAGAEVSAPASASSVTTNSITVTIVTAPENGQTVEYAKDTTDTAPSSGWQAGTTFDSLTEGTTYYFFARSAQNTNYNAGAESCSLAVTTLQTVSDSRIVYYWVDEHDSLVTTSNGFVVIAQDEILTITAQGAGYTVLQWHLNGFDTGERENTFTFSNTATGTYIVGLIVAKGGKYYNTNITITVVASSSFRTVYFDANGGSGTAPNPHRVQQINYTITLPSGSGLTRSDYTFGGWNTWADGYGTNYNAGASYSVNTNVTLYARWIPNYIVTFNANDGIGTAPDTQSVSPGTSITLPSGSGLTKDGYTFGGWNIYSDGWGTNYDAGESYTPTYSITLYARWLINYTVTFDINNATSGTAPEAQTAAYSTSITLPGGGDLTMDGYTFGGWNTSSYGWGTNYDAGESYTLYSDTTLYAKWNIAAPTGVTATAESSSNSITVSWNSVLNFGYYYVYRSTSAYGDYNYVEFIYSSTSYTDTGLSGSTTYYYRVAAYDSNYGAGSMSDYASATTPMPTTRTVIIDMYDSNNDGWDHNGALQINVNGTNSLNARLSSSSFGSYSFTVAPGDVVDIYWTGSTGNYHYESSFIVYYADTPPSPPFTTSSWNGSNALLFRLYNSISNTNINQRLGSFTVQ